MFRVQLRQLIPSSGEKNREAVHLYKINQFRWMFPLDEKHYFNLIELFLISSNFIYFNCFETIVVFVLANFCWVWKKCSFLHKKVLQWKLDDSINSSIRFLLFQHIRNNYMYTKYKYNLLEEFSNFRLYFS